MDPERRFWYLLVNGLTVTRAILSIGTVVAAANGDFKSAAIMAGISIVTDQEGTLIRLVNATRRINVATPLGTIRDLIADQCCYMIAWPAAVTMWAITQYPEHSLAIAGTTSLGLATGLRFFLRDNHQMLVNYGRTGEFQAPTHLVQ